MYQKNAFSPLISLVQWQVPCGRMAGLQRACLLPQLGTPEPWGLSVSSQRSDSGSHIQETSIKPVSFWQHFFLLISDGGLSFVKTIEKVIIFLLIFICNILFFSRFSFLGL